MQSTNMVVYITTPKFYETDNYLIYAETGRYPLYITVSEQIIKHWLR